MEQGTANAIGAIVGLLGGKLSGDVQQVQQAKQQRALSLADLQQAIQSNPEYAKDPLVAQRMGGIQQGSGTGELFKKMFFGGTPEMANADITMLQNALTGADNQRRASMLNEAYNPQVAFAPADMNEDTAKLMNTYGLPSQLSKNVGYNVDANASNWVMDNGYNAAKLGAASTEAPVKDANGHYKNNAINLESAPMGLTPALVESLFKTGAGNAVSKANVETQQKGAFQIAALREKGSTNRTRIQQEGANRRNAASNATRLQAVGISSATQKEIAKIRMTPDPEKNYQFLVRTFQNTNAGALPNDAQKKELKKQAQESVYDLKDSNPFTGEF